nr:MAG TPA: hypothetical protein [Caudoviricetes sp.]
MAHMHHPPFMPMISQYVKKVNKKFTFSVDKP